jgi:hypothetical protein
VLSAETPAKRRCRWPALVHDQLLSGVARGMGDLDWAALTQVIADNAGA